MEKRDLTELARMMRRAPTRSEDLFWQAVRNRRLDGVKFRRQQVIESFIVDFFAPSHRLVVEIDGGIHRNTRDHDAQRQQFLTDCGLRVMRISSIDVENRLEAVLFEVRRVLCDQEGPTSAFSPSPPAGEGVGG